MMTTFEEKSFEYKGKVFKVRLPGSVQIESGENLMGRPSIKLSITFEARGSYSREEDFLQEDKQVLADELLNELHENITENMAAWWPYL